jgi:hypothetical protein
MSLGRNKFFNSYANSFSKRRHKSDTTTSSSCPCETINVINDKEYTYYCSQICPNGNTSTASTKHNHNDGGSCETTIVDCEGLTLKIVSTPDNSETRTVTIYLPDGTTQTEYNSYFDGISTPYC